MASGKSSEPKWTTSPPSLFDIVTGFYPESNPKGSGPALRPCLVTRVLRSRQSGKIACEIAYGTKNLKTWVRGNDDIIIQNSLHLDEIGLPFATRFNLDDNMRIILYWEPPHFDCWSGYSSPKIGHLTEEYQKEYAWIMMRRMSE